MKLLFITRKFPPMVGGMEKLSWGLAQEFPKHVDTTIISWGKSQKYLPFFLPYAFFKALFLIKQKNIDHLHLGDALLSPLGLVLKKLYGIKVSVTVMGLDITYRLPIYQMIVPPCVAKLDTVICISGSTKNECVKRGIPEKKCMVIPPGIYPKEYSVAAQRKDLEKIVGKNLSGKKVVITVGRLVKRKGVAWFVESVFPKLDKQTIYLIIGSGPEKKRILETISKLDLDNQVFLLSNISDDQLKVIYNTADLFIMPNIKVQGNIEGFGIVAIEAASVGLPVISSDFEGITEAIHPEHNGYLVESENASEWVSAVQRTLSHNQIQPKHIREWTSMTFSWTAVGRKYFEALPR